MPIKGKRLNLIRAMRLNDFKLIAPVTFEGGCNRVIVENWLHVGAIFAKDDKAIIQKTCIALDFGISQLTSWYGFSKLCHPY